MSNIDLDELRKSITAEYTERIDVLKKEMASELAMLDHIEERTRALTAKPRGNRTSTRSKRTTRTTRRPAAVEEKKPSAKERILGAKQVLTGQFTRRELLETVNSDGQGEMRKGTFSPYVSAMIGKDIIEVEKAVGNNPSIYKWNED